MCSLHTFSAKTRHACRMHQKKLQLKSSTFNQFAMKQTCDETGNLHLILRWDRLESKWSHQNVVYIPCNIMLLAQKYIVRTLTLNITKVCIFPTPNHPVEVVTMALQLLLNVHSFCQNATAKNVDIFYRVSHKKVYFLFSYSTNSF